MPTKEDVIAVIKQCYDPEIPVNVYDLGLIYDVQVENDLVHVTMSLTTQGCPSAQAMPFEIENRIREQLGIDNVKVEVVWQPPWTPERISPEGRKILHLE
jgi:metal-sulfur cluster biosynthetic enzyme